MLKTHTKILCFGLTSIAIGFVPQHAQAECPCNQPAAMFPPAAFAPPRLAPRSPIRPLTANVPPGTLGRTYDLPSREIPADKHPRTAMIDVMVRGATSVRLLNINPHREQDDVDGFQAEGNNAQWRFETNPLIPGLPHIYKVIFRFSDEPNARETVRYVRLIPGRIVELVY